MPLSALAPEGQKKLPHLAGPVRLVINRWFVHGEMWKVMDVLPAPLDSCYQPLSCCCKCLRRKVLSVRRLYLKIRGMGIRISLLIPLPNEYGRGYTGQASDLNDVL